MEIFDPSSPSAETVLDQTFPHWGEGLTRRAYGQWNAAQLRTMWGSINLRRVGVVDAGRVLASAKSYSFRALVDGRECRTLGIGAVFTPPELRGQGHARRLVEEMLAAAKDQGCLQALLFSEIGPAYYQELGFSLIPRLVVDLEVDAHKPGSPAVLVRAGEDSDLEHIAALHAPDRVPDKIRERWLLQRSGDLIRYAIAKRRLLAGLGPPGLREVEFSVTEEGFRAVAYVLIARGPEGAWLLECGDRDPSGARVGAMLQSIQARTPAAAPPRLRAWLPAGWCPPQVRIVRSEPAAEVMMLRSLDEGSPIATLDAGDVRYWQADVF
jgi:GNAT superfamily N-acetyltransferase